ncbi:MAG: PQQ-dependent sugar dehydrogenase [Pseudomonadota bacterium]
MKSRILVAAAVLGLAAMPTMGAQPGPGAANPAAQGRQFFREQCLLCHSAEPGDNGGAQGPNLAGLLGRKAASGQGFNYTAALRNSGITWDAAALAHFLASPTEAVPGTSMVIPVPNEADRNSLIAYFTALRDGTLPAPAAPRGMGGGGFGPPRAAAGPPPGEAEWKKDAPGVVHRVDLDKLPAPFATPSANNFPQVVPKPADAELKVPPGFKVEVYLTGLSGPRNMQVAPNGDVFLAETNAGRVQVLRPSADGRTATPTVFAQGLQQPYGIAFHPSADNPQWVYIAEVNRVVRYEYRIGDTVARGLPEIVIPQLSPVGGGHFTRDIVFSKDGSKLFVSVGSQGNIFADSIAKKSPAEAQEWERQHGLGAPWGLEENRAMVRVYDIRNNDTRGRAYATGIRNCVGMTMQPATGDIWCAVNERDMLGDDLVPDYATRVKEGAFYGWPWYYMGTYEEPRMAGDRPDLRGKVTRPDVPFTAHSAATNIQFYNAKEGASLFPPEYHGVPFVVLHGSWNRGHRTGHKIVTLPLKDNVPTGEYVDFLTGFITPDNQAWGRPVAIQVLKDGSMLLADDGANVIYRISYSKP